MTLFEEMARDNRKFVLQMLNGYGRIIMGNRFCGDCPPGSKVGPRYPGIEDLTVVRKATEEEWLEATRFVEPRLVELCKNGCSEPFRYFYEMAMD